MSVSVKSLPVIDIVFENGRNQGGGEEVPVLPAEYDAYEGVVVDMEKVPMMEPEVFSSTLRASMSLWKKQVSPPSSVDSVLLHAICQLSVVEQRRQSPETENLIPVVCRFSPHEKQRTHAD